MKNEIKIDGKKALSLDGFFKRFSKKDKEVKKSVVSDLNKAFDEKYIDEQTYDSLLEKAWKKQPIGTVTTHKDGKKYRKVSETGNMDQDWKLVSKDKTGVAKDKPEQSSEAKQVEIKQSKKEMQESAKNTSETALNNAIKQSPDPEVRQSAHEELQRRESEEKPKEEEKNIKIDKEKIGSLSLFKELTSFPESEDDQHFYHTTFSSNIDKIYKDGLIPTIGNNFEDFSTGKYVSLSPSNKDNEYWSSMLFWRSYDKDKKVPELSFLRIKKDNLKNAQKYRIDEYVTNKVDVSNLRNIS